MKNSYMLLVAALLIMLSGCTSIKGTDKISLKSEAYTHEELIALSDEQLLDLFVERGLKINEELRTVFTEEELQSYFKAEFETLCQGIANRSATMYFDLANQTKEIYEAMIYSD